MQLLPLVPHLCSVAVATQVPMLSTQVLHPDEEDEPPPEEDELLDVEDTADDDAPEELLLEVLEEDEDVAPEDDEAPEDDDEALEVEDAEDDDDDDDEAPEEEDVDVEDDDDDDDDDDDVADEPPLLEPVWSPEDPFPLPLPPVRRGTQVPAAPSVGWLRSQVLTASQSPSVSQGMAGRQPAAVTARASRVAPGAPQPRGARGRGPVSLVEACGVCMRGPAYTAAPLLRLLSAALWLIAASAWPRIRAARSVF